VSWCIGSYSCSETALRYGITVHRFDTLSSVGRPREHGEEQAGALIAAAEAIVERDGIEALTVRAVADAAGTTTRAVYSLFGSKDGLLVALGTRGFELLREGVEALPATDDPAADLVTAAVEVFRRFMLEHPALYRVAVQQTLPDRSVARGFRDTAREALAGLSARFEPLADAGLLGDRPVHDAVRAFHAQCEGLAALELRGMLPAGQEEQAWRDALGALVRGLAVPA
jgi:AcrR family transcriptional regulator